MFSVGLHDFVTVFDYISEGNIILILILHGMYLIAVVTLQTKCFYVLRPKGF